MRLFRTAVAAMVMLCLAQLSAPRALAAQSKSRDLITREDIENSAQKDADIYSVIRALRPKFLEMPRGVRTLGNSSVRMSLYVDGARESGFDALKRIPASSVEEVRYQDPSTAESEHGFEASGGALVVKRLKAPATPPPDL
ncbi:MAG TPA: hypothetical protein VF929_04310 [Gemmatimonadaceae bacterium]